MAGTSDNKTPRKGGEHVNGQSGVWKWISGLLASVLVTGIGGFAAGTHLNQQSEESLKREVRVERTEFVTDYVDKKISPRLAALEAGQNLILEELRKRP